MKLHLRIPQWVGGMSLVTETRMGRVTALGLAALMALTHVPAAFASFNSGFEDGWGGWTIESKADDVRIVGTEGPAQFSIYGEWGVQVAPYNGAFQARLGTPKTQNETQNRGKNTISQTFTATSSNLAVPLRLFSLEHRADDIFRFSLVQRTGSKTQLSVTKFVDASNRNAVICPAKTGAVSGEVSCAATIDVGKRQQFIDTGWQTVTFSGLAPGAEYVLRIELEAGQNESLASWLYVDGVNLAPSAVIRFNPGSTGGAVEGDFVVFDCLQSVDPENSNLSCIWTATFPGVSSQSIIGNTVVYAFPKDGTGTVSLQVTDGEKSTTTSTSLTIRNQLPLVNALDVEVLPGGTVDLVCRYADPGPFDSHTVSFSVATGQLERVDENVPALSSGIARASYQAPSAPGEITGSCRVTDELGSGSDQFTITVLDPDELADRVASNTGSTQPVPGTQLMPEVLRADQSTLGGLISPDSVAVYEIRLPNGDPLPSGAEVSVTAHFPADYDIVLLSGSADPTFSAAPWVSAPFVSAPFVSAPFVSVPFVSAPFVSAPFVSAPFVSAPFVSAPFVSAPFVSAPFVSAPFVSAPFVSAPLTNSLWLYPGFEFENFPLSLLAGAPDGSNISGVDVSFEDLGALGSGSLVDEPVFVKGLSAEFGTNSEHLLVKVSPGERGLYLAVIPQAGSFSSAPFSVEVEASVPPDTATLLGPACDGEPLVDTHSGLEVLRNYGSKTLIVTQKRRLMTTFGMDEAAWNAWMSAMDPFFSNPKVAATVVSVPSDWYDDADTHPCAVQKQNAVAELIKEVIDDYRTTSTEFVQLMGSLDIIPPYYVPDETQTGNESLFASDLLTLPGRPLGVAIGEGYMLTDAFYVDSDPQPFNGRQLFLEDISVSRMVETPEEILANAQRFVQSGGVINLLSVEAGTPGAGTQSTGYDFFIDGTEVINEILTTTPPYNQVPNTTQNDDVWDASLLRCQFFGKGEGCTKPVSAVNAVNAHMSYNAALTAKGFGCEYLPDYPVLFPGLCDNQDPLGEVVLSNESAGIYEDPDWTGPAIAINGVTFSIGCHSGLSVPDAWGLPEELNLPLDPARDWVQELGTWVGSYNFAYGDTDVADRGTEGIMPLVIENFGKGMTLGEALVRAKWRYAAGLFEFGVYDEKSLVGLNLFGMPQATLEDSVGAGVAVAQFAAGASITEVGTPAGNLVVNYVEKGMESTTGGTIELASGDKGIVYSIDGHAEAIVGRPLLPVIKPFELRPVVGTSVHGVALRGGAYTTYLDQDPVFPAQTHDQVVHIEEPQPCVETLSPSLIGLVNTYDPPGELLQSFIVQSGQFQCTNAVDAGTDGYLVNGDFRIWNALNLELMHPVEASLDSDLKPPVVTRQELLGNPATGIVNATLDAVDESGIREIIALVYRDDDGLPGGTGTATPYSVTDRTDGVFQLTLPDAFDNRLSFQYIDNAGNITAKTLKGALLQAIEVRITTSIINLSGGTSIKVRIGDFDSLIEPYLVVNFGDGSGDQIYQFNDLDVQLVGSDAIVTIPWDYSSYTGDSVVVRVEVKASGALGSDEKTLTFFNCVDEAGDVAFPNADIVACSISSSGTHVTIGVVVAGAIADDIQYRLFLPDTNTQIKYAAGAVTGPNKLKPLDWERVGTSGVNLMFDAARLGWDGVSPFRFVWETQDGISGGQGQGFVDSTDVKTYQP